MIGIVSGILAVVILLVGFGILYDTVIKKGRPVAMVGTTKITSEQFEKRVQYERLAYVDSFTSYAASGYAQLFQSYLLEMQNALDNYIQFGSDVLDKMINEAVVAAKAEELGITVSEEDIDKEIERGFGFSQTVPQRHPRLWSSPSNRPPHFQPSNWRSSRSHPRLHLSPQQLLNQHIHLNQLTQPPLYL